MPGTGWPEPGGFLPRKSCGCFASSPAKDCAAWKSSKSRHADVGDQTALIGTRARSWTMLATLVNEGKLGTKPDTKLPPPPYWPERKKKGSDVKVKSKSEIRNPKEVRNPKREQRLRWPASFSAFGLRTSFGFRISDLGLRPRERSPTTSSALAIAHLGRDRSVAAFRHEFVPATRRRHGAARAASWRGYGFAQRDFAL